MVAVAGIVLTGWSWSGVVLAVALYYARMFFLTAGYHRYFSHRSFKASRLVQFLLALGGTLCLQKGPLWWAANHRVHHRYADRPTDLHSRGYGACGGRTSAGSCRASTRRRSGSASPTWPAIPSCAGSIATGSYRRWRWRGVLWLAGGWWALLWGFFVSTDAALARHVHDQLAGARHRQPPLSDGRRQPQQRLSLALLTMGEGWHNNHHRYPGAERQGFFWWEVDVTHYVLSLLAWFGVVSELRQVPAPLLRAEHAVVQAQPARDR